MLASFILIHILYIDDSLCKFVSIDAIDDHSSYSKMNKTIPKGYRYAYACIERTAYACIEGTAYACIEGTII